MPSHSNQEAAINRPPRKPSRKSLVLAYLDVHAPAEVTRETLTDLRRHVSERLQGTQTSDHYLLSLVEQTQLPISRDLGALPPDLRGRVHFHDFASAEASLREMQNEYESASEAGNRGRMQDCRRAVLRCRQRLQFALNNPNVGEAKRVEKQEILKWFRVWLGDPALFSTWIDLRREVLRRQAPRNETREEALKEEQEALRGSDHRVAARGGRPAHEPR